MENILAWTCLRFDLTVDHRVQYKCLYCIIVLHCIVAESNR